MATGSYKLELDPPKRNVFVTQLHEREEEEDDIAQYPVVKENAGKLLETGLNTLQRTLLLKKEVEVNRVDEELRAKREEFKLRMEACSEKQVDVQKRQQEMKDRVTKFEKFINENESKRRRAIQKYQQEVKLKAQKDKEFETLCSQLEELRARHDYLKRKLAKYEKYKAYLMSVLGILPAHYLEENDSMLNSLIMRHRTLSDTNQSLIDNLADMSDKLESLKQHLEEMQDGHNKMKISINSELSLKQKQQEVKLDKNQEQEQHFGMEKVQLRNQISEFGQVIMAITNLSEKCKRRVDPELEGLNLQEKLSIIKAYVMDKEDVVRMVGTNDLGLESPPPHGRSTQHSETRSTKQRKHTKTLDSESQR